jgi:hypothetical protein
MFRKINLLGGSYVLDVSVVKNLKVFDKEKKYVWERVSRDSGIKWTPKHSKILNFRVRRDPYLQD